LQLLKRSPHQILAIVGSVGLFDHGEILLTRVRGIGDRDTTIDVVTIFPSVEHFQDLASNAGAGENGGRCTLVSDRYSNIW
jgi:hypothetical protein